MNKAKLLALLKNPTFILILWILLALVAGTTKYLGQTYDNFNVYRGSFFHMLDQTNLYDKYPSEYGDVFLYGISFAALMAPFAIFPTPIGILLWVAFSAAVLFYAIRKLPLEKGGILLILWFCTNELYTSLTNLQYNILTAAFIILTFALVEKRKDMWATLFIAIGIFTKIYGAGALTFFLFSKEKRNFILSLCGWSLALFLLPALFCNFDFLLQSYQDWMERLVLKSGANITAYMQNISLIGLVKRITGMNELSDLLFIIPGLLLFAAPYVRFKQYQHLSFRLASLASVLMFIVLFSNSSESSTYILAFVGVGVWYLSTPTQSRNLNLGLMIFAFVLSSFGATDLMPEIIQKSLIRPYALKALPITMIWLKLIAEMLLCDYGRINDRDSSCTSDHFRKGKDRYVRSSSQP